MKTTVQEVQIKHLIQIKKCIYVTNILQKDNNLFKHIREKKENKRKENKKKKRKKEGKCSKYELITGCSLAIILEQRQRDE